MKKALIALGLILFSLVIIFSINSILLFNLHHPLSNPLDIKGH